MKERIAGKVALHLDRSLVSAEATAEGARLTIAARDGTQETLETDHIIAATGYVTDIERLEFLGPDLRSRIRTTSGSPALSVNYESTAPGLYFVGPASAASFGPVARFACGAIHPSRRLARHLAASLVKSSRGAPRPSGEQAVAS
jgi:lysine/ornithine N-monooxygenase